MPLLVQDIESLPQELWDACIIGAGPAGSMSALLLAKAGYRVLLADKAIFPRPKACGGCLGGLALDSLAAAGCSLDELELEANELTHLVVASGSTRARLQLPRRVAVCRRSLDAALADRAVASGVTFLNGVSASVAAGESDHRSVQLRGGSQRAELKAKLVIVAAGLNSAKQLGGETLHLGTSPNSRLGCSGTLPPDSFDLAPDELRMVCGKQGEGYVGLVRLPGGSIHVAAALSPTKTQSHSASEAAHSRSVKMMSSILLGAGLPVPDELATTAWSITPQFPQKPTKLGLHRLLLVGDAAGYVEPFTGEGIGWAVCQALAIQLVAAKSIEKWQPELVDDWTRLHQKQMQHHHRRCRTICSLLGGHTWSKHIVRALSVAPWFATPFVRRVDSVHS